jgi:hypothetical protein
LLGDALLFNNNLNSLDISKNRLGDVGIRNILYPLLMQGLINKGVFSDDEKSRIYVLR